MHKKINIVTALVSLLVPVIVLAAPPSSVHSIVAESTPSGVRVQWAAAEGDIASYNVFYSHESILDNNALFDDSVSTNGSVTELTLPRLAGVSDLYVTVLAVNRDGEESPLFEEEAHVDISKTTEPTAALDIAQPAPTIGSPSSGVSVLRALRVESVSGTGVLLTFSAPIVLDQQSVKTVFTIQDGKGGTLAIYRIVATGTGVLLATLPQEQRQTYRVHIDPSLRGRTVDGENEGTVLTLDPDQTDLLFVGSLDGVPPSASPAILRTTISATGDVQNLQAQTAYEGGNRYTVQLAWQPPQGSFAGYRVSQTVDGGATFGAIQTLSNAVNSVRIPGVQSGELGILVQVVAADQSLSRGVFQRIILPSAYGTSGRVVTAQTVRSTPQRNVRLPQTGIGTLALLAIAGGCAGVQVQRRKSRTA